MRTLRYLRFYIALGGLYLGAIVYFSLSSLPPDGPQVLLSDKALHLLGYFLLMAWFGQLAQARDLRAKLALAFMALGAGLEVLQGLGGLRQMELADAAANALGVWMGHWSTRGPLGGFLQQLEARFLR